ncbi:MAG: WbqC family protein [Tannerella sp.]|jgi:hypothetical protein|nr:WbqC family protein [Tannerella sp.]
MNLGVMQPYFFPYLGYFQLIGATDKFILHDHSHFIKRRWIHRNRILIRQTGIIYITVPLKKASSNKRISEIEIEYSVDWQRKILKTFMLNYKHAHYFHEIYPFIETILRTKHQTIAELNFDSIRAVCNLLEIDTAIVYGSEPYFEIEEALKSQPSSPYDLKTQRVIAVCKQEGADTYTNAIGGQALYNKQIFADNGIRLQFIQTLPYQYPQLTKTFYPDLSILDVLFHCGVKDTKKLLSYYELI